MASEHNQRTSKILQRVIDECDGQDITVEDLMKRLGDRAFALPIFIFGILSIVAGAVPGFSTVTGVAILLLSLQMVLGRDVIWLPSRLMQKELSQSKLRELLAKSLPAVVWLEKIIRPRWQWVGTPWGERLVGLVIAVLAGVLALPIPGGNFLPSISISILALAVLERDGVLAALGITFVLSTGTLMIKLIIAAVEMVTGWISDWF